MSGITSIEWSDRVWNPVVGCTAVSPGCAYCYAKALHDKRHMAYRAGKLQFVPQYAQPFEIVQLLPGRLTDPLGWRKPAHIFVNSVSDLFHDDVALDFLLDVFATMALAHWHTFQVLTKRPARMHELLVAPTFARAVAATVAARTKHDVAIGPWPLPNVWLGVSVENQRWANERIPLLLDTPAAVRFLSCEPLLGPVRLTAVAQRAAGGSYWVDALRGEEHFVADSTGAHRVQVRARPSIDWVITGAESGPDRPSSSSSSSRAAMSSGRRSSTAADGRTCRRLSQPRRRRRRRRVLPKSSDGSPPLTRAMAAHVPKAVT